jgi:hypothetical protein
MIIRLAFLAMGLLGAAEITPPGDRLTVHEWGTFTSIANSNGVPQIWLPLSEPSDLPCFVHRFEGVRVKGAVQGTVRMETPVLYFYSPRPITASVHVDFRGGILTEWYPRAKVEPDFRNPATIEWNPIKISREEHALPVEPGLSRYYAARHTDALHVESSGEHDKLLFYRGVGTFDVPLRAALSADGQLLISNKGSPALPLVVAFENHGGRIRYAMVREFTGQSIVELKDQTHSLRELRKELAADLVQDGLYPMEATAMLNTWSDSWFEEGLRVIYIVPKSVVDQVLPLAIAPRPVEVARTYVGRVEVLAPWMRNEIIPALRDGNLTVLSKYGRFLQSFMQQIGTVPHAEGSDTWLRSRNSAIQGAEASKSCGK